MQLTQTAGSCPDRLTCPAVYETDRGTLVVQGYTLSALDLANIELPEGETAVEIPVSLLEEAARARSR